MGRRGIVFVATIALIVLAGCATHQRTGSVARLTESDVRPAVLPADLVGTWRGSFGPVGASSGGDTAVGTVTIVINEDGTYTATDQRRGSMRNYSGVVVVKGNTITLRTSTARSVSLRRRGDVLYGMAHDQASGYRIQISVEKDSSALASPPSSPSGRE